MRDLLLGRPVSDVDLAVEGDCVRFCEDFARHCSARMVSVGQAFQSFRVIREGEQLDFASLQGNSLHEDLRRRDITINAMALPLSALHPEDGLLDPCRGQRDLRGKTVRMVRAQNLADDPLRLLRVFRFAAELEFRIHPLTLASVRVRAGMIRPVPGERVFPELKRVLSAGHTAQLVRDMAEHRLLFELVPELERTVSVSQNRYHHLGVWDHTLLALEKADAILEHPDRYFPGHGPSFRTYLGKPGRSSLLRLAILLHDVAKPRTRTRQADGRITFYGHETEGARMTDMITKRMKASRAEGQRLARLVRHHLKVQQLRNVAPRRSTLARLVREMKDDILGLLIVGLADLTSKKGPARSAEAESAYLELATRILDVRNLLEASEKTVRPLVTGRDLMEAFSLRPSARLGAALEALRDAVDDGTVTTKEEALEFARLFLADTQNSL